MLHSIYFFAYSGLVLFSKTMPPVKGDIVNLAPYHFYMKVSGDESEDAFSGQTVPLDIELSDAVNTRVVANSRNKYATPKSVVEARMEVLFAATQPTPADVTVKKKSSTKTHNTSDVDKSRKTHGV